MRRTSTQIAATTALTGELCYKAYGEARYAWGITNTMKYHFTGQREESAIGLYFYNARWYDPALGRFVQADSIVPQPGNPQALNRYSYALNNALRYTDPSGHAACEDEECRELTRVPANVREKYTRALWLTWMTMQRVVESRSLAFVRGANAARSPIPGLSETAKGAGYIVFAWHVRQGGDWHMKAVMRKDAARRGEEKPYEAVKYSAIEVGGPEYYYDIFGNFSYGYWGRDAGYSMGDLLDKAGEAQLASDAFDTIVACITGGDRRNLPTRPPDTAWWRGRAWDNPGDAQQIQAGARLWDQHGAGVTADELAGALKALAVHASP